MISLLPAPRELVQAEGAWRTANPLVDARRAVDPSLPPDEYRIDVTPDGAQLTAGSADALRHAEQTFHQLASGAGTEGVPCVHISDAPEFAWRGLMLDVARHFMPKEFVLRLIDALELHRMNVLHLHLTDDQGWRVEIDAYPRLTEVGAWRSYTAGEPHDDPYGGYYTKDDLREIVAHAAARGVTVVPEIDLPGHMQAAIAAYPELGNHPETPVGVRRYWGISKRVLNVEESTVEFVRTVLREVLEIFPGPYVHLGGDECPTVEWSESADTEARMAAEGIEGFDHVQGWFTRQVATVLAEAGRRMVGWDEILLTDPLPDAVVMAWRGAFNGVAAAKAGYDVVMAPSEWAYFDHYQEAPESEPHAIGGLTTLESVFAAEVVPAWLPDEERARVLGAQCQIWTEYIPTPDHVGYMLFPRMCAFAERAWGSPRTSHDDFLARLRPHLDRIEALGLNYRPVDPCRFRSAVRRW